MQGRAARRRGAGSVLRRALYGLIHSTKEVIVKRTRLMNGTVKCQLKSRKIKV